MDWLKANLDRPRSGAVYADEYIERWAAVYLANPALRLYGVPFSDFLARPEAWLRYIGDPLRAMTRTPSAACCERRAEAAVAQAERLEGYGANGRLVEKMRHKARPRSFRAFLPLRDA